MWQIWKSSINLTHNQITSCHSTVIVFVCLFVTHVQRGWYGFYFALARYAELPRVVRVAQMLTDPGERKKVCSFIHICLTLQCPNANYLLNGSCLLVLNLWTVTLRYEQSCKDSWRDAWCTTRDTCVFSSSRHLPYLLSLTLFRPFRALFPSTSLPWRAQFVKSLLQQICASTVGRGPSCQLLLSLAACANGNEPTST